MKTFFILFLSFVSAHAALKQVANVGSKKYFVDAALTPDSPHLSWNDALKFCKQNKMALATINNKAEQDALNDWRRKFRTFIGATNAEDEANDWIWESTGKPVTFTNWGDSGGRGYYGKKTCSSMIGLKPEGDKPYLLPPSPQNPDGTFQPLPLHGDWRPTSCDDNIGQALCEMV